MSPKKANNSIPVGIPNRIPVLITTDKDKRGVFFGYIDPEQVNADPLPVTDVQMCIMWTKEVKGVLGLAATGPTKDCRVSKPVPKGHVKGVTLVLEASEEAEKAWKKMPWG